MSRPRAASLPRPWGGARSQAGLRHPRRHQARRREDLVHGPVDPGRQPQVPGRERLDSRVPGAEGRLASGRHEGRPVGAAGPPWSARGIGETILDVTVTEARPAGREAQPDAYTATGLTLQPGSADLRPAPSARSSSARSSWSAPWLPARPRRLALVGPRRRGDHPRRAAVHRMDHPRVRVALKPIRCAVGSPSTRWCRGAIGSITRTRRSSASSSCRDR